MTDEGLRDGLRAVDLVLSTLDRKHLLMVLSPMLVRLMREFGPTLAKEMVTSTIDVLEANTRKADA